MKVDGIVASDVSVIPDKGVGLQIMMMDLGVTLGFFVPQDKVNGETKLKMGDNVIAEIRKPYASGRDVKFNIDSVKLNNDKFPKSHKA
jgi:hypothetical protein